jgi:toxin ParE1/3/4
VNEVVLSELAEADLTDIWIFVAQDDLPAANRLLDQIYEKCRLLSSSPKAGRKRPELNRSIRSFPVGNYVIFYRESAIGIEVARASRSARHSVGIRSLKLRSMLFHKSCDRVVRLLRLLHPEAMARRFQDHLLRAFDVLGQYPRIFP